MWGQWQACSPAIANWGFRSNGWRHCCKARQWKQGGKPKRGYEHERVAKQEAARFGKTYYRCEVCDKFHLASAPK